jgi:hypothetical protein
VKKVRLNLKRGVRSWSFTLYDSAESAFYLKDEPEYDDRFEEDYRKVITIKPGDIVEAEWLGSEWVYDDDYADFFSRSYTTLDNSHEKYDKVRVGKISPMKGTTQKLGYLEVYSGWVLGTAIPWSPEEGQTKVRITEIKDKVVSKFDFTELFKGNEVGFLNQENEDKIESDGVLN